MSGIFARLQVILRGLSSRWSGSHPGQADGYHFSGARVPRLAGTKPMGVGEGRGLGRATGQPNGSADHQWRSMTTSGCVRVFLLCFLCVAFMRGRHCHVRVRVCMRQNLPFQQVAHQVTSTDCHPTINGGILVHVCGNLVVLTLPPYPFMHAMHAHARRGGIAYARHGTAAGCRARDACT